MSFFEEQCPEMDRYLEEHASAEPPLLKQLRRETYQKTTQPHMISGYQQGRLLSVLSQMMQPARILEIGTFTGYATLCLAEGLPPSGIITTLDINEDLAYLPRKFFEQSPHAAQIDFRLMDAVTYLQETDETFDLVFVDADKERYPDYFKLLKNHLRSGSVVLFDNVLWYGKVLQENAGKKATKAIQALNDLIAADADFENVILPLRDGLHMARKK